MLIDFKDGFRKILRRDGLPGLFRGWGASLCTYIPEGAIWWGSYYHMRNYVLQKTKETHFVNFCLGATAETIASLCIYPVIPPSFN